MTQQAKQETNKYKRAWIWIWYNDVTRFGVLFGIPVIPVVLFLLWLGVDGEAIRQIAVGAYIALFAWAMIDNNYSNLRRIGMNEYRKKLK